MKTVIMGIPKSGKTDASGNFENVIHTDNFMFLNWTEQSEFLQNLFSLESDFTLEGVAAVRALRKWMSRNKGKPCEQVYWLDYSFEELSKGQETMAKAVTTIFNEIEPELKRRGVAIDKGGL